MRYIKVLVLAVLFFLAMVFFFQNQTPLSQQMELGLNLFFIPPMTSIPLPFYFIVIAAFLAGCILAVAFLLWDKLHISARLMKSKWQVSNLEREIAKLKKQLEPAGQGGGHSFFQRKKQQPLAQGENSAVPVDSEQEAEKAGRLPQ